MGNRKFFQIWVKGCCNNIKYPNYGGWAYMVYEDENLVASKSGNASHTTNNIMELTAIVNAVSSLPENSVVAIATDSRYCIGCLRGRFEPKSNIELIKSYFRVVQSKNLDVQFYWIKCRSTKGSEMVNDMADAEFVKAGGDKVPDYKRLSKDEEYRKSVFHDSRGSKSMKALWDFVSSIVNDKCPKDEAYIQNKVTELHNIICLNSPNRGNF